MIQIDLGGFLLNPIQRICKYPLQLQELLKTFNAENDEPVYSFVKDAMSVMRRLANTINEKKRKYEERSKIEKWQQNCIQWRGEDILTRR